MSSRSKALWSKIRSKWRIYIAIAIPWIIFELLKEFVFGGISDYFKENHEGVLALVSFLWGHPEIIVAIILLVFGIWVYIASKKEMRLKREEDEYEEITIIEVPPELFEPQKPKRIHLGDYTVKKRRPKRKDNEV